MRKIIIFLIFNLSFLLFSEDLKKESWRIEWGELQGNDLSLSNQFLVTTIPTYFIDNIQLDHEHYLESDESGSVLDKLVISQIDTLTTSLTKKIKARDELYFNKKSSADSYNKVLEEIKKIRDEITSFQDLDITELDKIISLPIIYLPAEGKPLTSKKDYQIKNYIEQEDIDYFVTGNIEEISDNIILNIKLYSKYSDTPKILWSGIGTNEEILSYREDILDSLSRIIISENIKKYQVDVIPSDALIYINQKFRGLGSYTGYFLDGDNLNLEISKEGYKSLSMNKIVSSTENSLYTELIPIETETIVISSEPKSASAYYGSRYIGKTPLEVPVFSFSQKLTLSLDGYMDRSVVIHENSKDMNIKLKKGYIDPEENFIKEKSRFYTATAIFSFSLAVPLYFDIQGDNINGVLNNISIGNAIFWGINLFYRLYQYLRAAELSVE